MKERTISALRDYKTAKVYVRFSCNELCKEFYQKAEKEGFRFGNIKPTECEPNDLIAIQEDLKLAFVGFAGHLAYHNPQAVAGGLTRIDYERYISGDEDYLI